MVKKKNRIRKGAKGTKTKETETKQKEKKEKMSCQKIVSSYYINASK